MHDDGKLLEVVVLGKRAGVGAVADLSGGGLLVVAGGAGELARVYACALSTCSYLLCLIF